MLQKILLEANDLAALRRGEDRLLVVGDHRVILALANVRLNGNGRAPAPAERLGRRKLPVGFVDRIQTRKKGETLASIAREFSVAPRVAAAAARLLRRHAQSVPAKYIHTRGTDGRRFFTKAFTRRVKRIYRRSGQSAEQVATQLGIDPSTLRRMVKHG